MAPPIRTERLLLRRFVSSDAEAVHGLADDTRLAAMMSRLPHPYLAEMAEAWFAGHDADIAEQREYPLAVLHGEVLVGCVSLMHYAGGSGELGYWVGVPYWGRGYATEAARAMLAFGREHLGLGQATARCMADNGASARVLEKCGFARTGESAETHPLRGEVTMLHWGRPL